MRKLLNTLYVTRENGYLSLDGENVVLTEKGEEIVRLPFANLESIYCFNYLGCSPALMGKCAEENVSLCFMSPHGRFLARVTGKVKGNVFLRKQQIERFSDNNVQAELIRAVLLAKLKNTRNLLLRSRRDNPNSEMCESITHCLDILSVNLKKIESENNIDRLRGLEGESAKAYFEIFDSLLLQQREYFRMFMRSKKPPLDRINAVLSFLYTICTNDIAAALECVGLDPYIGFYHTLRAGRVSLACDIVEEFRSVIERLVISAINLLVINKDDFTEQIGGAVYLNDTGLKKVIRLWQEKKRENLVHPILKEKVQFGLFPYVQANLMAKFIRKEIDRYPCFQVN